jgi:hypothetical protein
MSIESHSSASSKVELPGIAWFCAEKSKVALPACAQSQSLKRSFIKIASGVCCEQTCPKIFLDD